MLASSQNCEKRLSASSCLSICLSPLPRPHGTTRLPLDVFLWDPTYRACFENLSRKFKLSLKSDKNNGYFIWSPLYIYDHISLSFSENEKYIKKKNMVGLHRTQMAIYHSACALHATYQRLQTHTICNIHCLSTASMVARTRLNVTLCAHCLSCS